MGEKGMNGTAMYEIHTMHQLFGGRMDALLDELNEVLVA